MNKILTILLATFLVACGPEPTTQMYAVTSETAHYEKPKQQSIRYSDPNVNAMKPTVAEIGPERIRVVRSGVFKDDLAYGNLRGIYIITDTKTGKEYLGISGVGISETGSHQVGKFLQRMKDDRLQHRNSRTVFKYS